jgi:hypothetical protein
MIISSPEAADGPPGLNLDRTPSGPPLFSPGILSRFTPIARLGVRCAIVTPSFSLPHHRRD